MSGQPSNRGAYSRAQIEGYQRHELSRCLENADRYLLQIWWDTLEAQGLGMLPGAELEVIQNSGHGPFVIAVKGSRIVIGRGMAARIAVE